MNASVPRIAIGAPSSAAGKTTLCIGLLRALKRRGLAPQPFKCGPDYIDTQFHRVASGRSALNLDLYFTDEDRARSLFVRGAEGADIALVEGAMGYYDGAGATEQGSTYRIARALSAPTLLVLDARSSALSLAAVAQGVARFRDDAGIAAVALSRCPASRVASLAPEIERATGAPVLGCLPYDPSIALPSRHLGLVGASEIAGLDATIDRIADALERTFDVSGLVGIASHAPDLSFRPFETPVIDGPSPVIAVARDEAFCFYYEENLRMLRDLGARLVAFSPLADTEIPAEADALYLGGGYPELHARELSENSAMLRSVRGAIEAGMPCVAECGGFLYLQRSVADPEGVPWPMVGALPGESRDGGKLSHFGYAELRTRRAGLFGPAGTVLRAHEFHRWASDFEGADAIASKPGGTQSWPCVVTTDTLFAGFPHLYWPGNPEVATRFVQAAQRFRESRAGRPDAAQGGEKR